MKVLSGEEEEEKSAGGQEAEVKENHSINSAVINGLFEGILEQSQELNDCFEEEEEEDALNISSMSLLTPLAETVAAVVKSPDRRMMVGSTSYCASGSWWVLLMSVRLPADLNSCHLLHRKEHHPRSGASTHQVPDEQPGGERLLRQHGLLGPGSQAAIQVEEAGS